MRSTAAHPAPGVIRPGAELLIREITPADRRALAFVLGHLSNSSRYLRFFGTALDTREEIERLIDVDHWHHEALIAYSPPPRAPIAVVEYVRLERFDVADLAIAVTDDWQGQGVGRALLEVLRGRALAAGVRRFSASMLASNRAALALARRFGAVSARESRGELIELVLEL